MSALEQAPSSNTISISERRHESRLRIDDNTLVYVGRGQGLLVDLSTRGARVRHAVQARRASNVRLSFDWEGARFAATAEVLSSHVVTLGRGDVPTLYDSRLRFRLITEEASALLGRMLSSRETSDERRWLANLEGNSESALTAPATRTNRSYLRCRLIGMRWERKWTHDRVQPQDGFLLPESVEAKDIDKLCTTYEGLDEDGRQLVRLIAATSIQL